MAVLLPPFIQHLPTALLFNPLRHALTLIKYQYMAIVIICLISLISSFLLSYLLLFAQRLDIVRVLVSFVILVDMRLFGCNELF